MVGENLSMVTSKTEREERVKRRFNLFMSYNLSIYRWVMMFKETMFDKFLITNI